MISAFPISKAYNPGGYTSFMFLPYQQVTAYPMISNGATVVPVTTVDDQPWLKGYATRETLTFEEDPQMDSHGTYYNLTIAGFIPGETAALIDLMDTMADYRYLSILKDVNGILRLIGSPAAPLTFSAKFNSGGNRADAKGFNFKFIGQSLYRAPRYIA